MFQLSLPGNSYRLFIEGLKSPVTKAAYSYALQKYMNHLKLKNPDDLLIHQDSSVTSFNRTIGSEIEEVEKDSLEDVIASNKNIKIVIQLPINNKKEDLKVIANDDYSITISHLNNEGKQCTRTSGIPYDIDFETAKATYKNGILEVTFDRS